MKNLKKILFAAIAGMVIASWQVQAVGTRANTPIANTATITYDIGTVTGLSEVSNTETVTVSELLDVEVTTLSATLNVNPLDTERVQTFQIQNIGNGTDRFQLSVISTDTVTDEFNPSFQEIRIEGSTPANTTYEPADDVLYLGGADDPLLGPDEIIVVHVLNTIPNTNHGGGAVVDGDTGETRLIATSREVIDAGLTAGTLIEGNAITPTFHEPAVGNDGDLAIVGFGGGRDDSIGTYVISSVIIQAVKTQLVLDPFGGTQVIPGSIITYTITVDVTSGGGTADNVVFSDPIPAGTTYLDPTPASSVDAGSITLNGSALTDVNLDDAGDFGLTVADTVTVALGNLNNASPTQTITFQVTVTDIGATP